ncbi:hypothetical protein IFM89_017523 [Coptis chinensis]|uniref:Transmembrane protein n=1 Tax=Coptis chinensis TaxID=261450 RepID=A0A835HUD2_9MAGN|nr:hypothetical protein IFM89_017523 [Coptis chinensis]
MELTSISPNPFPFQKHPFPTTLKKDSHFLLTASFLESKKRTSLLVHAQRKKNARRATFRISTKAALECAFFIASSLNIIPEPVNIILKEGFGGGNGGGSGFWNGFRGGGGFEGWKGRRRSKLWILGLLVMIVVSVFLVVLMLGKDFEGYGEMGLGVLGLGLLMVLERDWKRGVRGWTFGFCSCALMVFFGFKRDELQKLVKGFKVNTTFLDLFRKKRRTRFL